MQVSSEVEHDWTGKEWDENFLAHDDFFAQEN